MGGALSVATTRPKSGERDASLFKQWHQCFGYCSGETGWHGIPDLSGNLDFGTDKMEIIGESLKPRGFTVCDRPMLARMEVSPFLGLVKLRAYGE